MIKVHLVSLAGADVKGITRYYSQYMYRFDDQALHPADLDQLVGQLLDQHVLNYLSVISVTKLRDISPVELPDGIRVSMVKKMIAIDFITLGHALEAGYITAEEFEHVE